MWWETTFTMPRMEIATSRPHTLRATPEDQCDTYRHCIYFSIWPGIQVTMNMTTVHELLLILGDGVKALGQEDRH